MDERLTVLVVDDDADIRSLLGDYLGANGFEVMLADSAATMRARLQECVPAVVLLDIGLPGEDGLSLARQVRASHDIGIIIVSGAGETVDRIIGLEVGADDYLSKPFDLRELRARLKSVLRRYQRAAAASAVPAAAAGQRVRVGVAVLDLVSCQLFAEDGSEIPMTAGEFELLKTFVERPRRPLSRDQLMNATQHRDWDPFDRSIDIRIARLRKKIERDADKPRALKTMRGIGYMFIPDA